jgi:hypothetical protein
MKTTEAEIKAHLSIEEHLRGLRDDALRRAESETAQALDKILGSVSDLRVKLISCAEMARGDPARDQESRVVQVR